ncbi:unnamed protein product, partial [marine sediment metagenome]
MAGKEMLVKFFSLGPINSIFSLKALQITDSAYVAHSEDLLYRQGYEEFKNLNGSPDFFFFLHSSGRLKNGVSTDIDKRRIYIDLEENEVYSVNNQYVKEKVEEAIKLCKPAKVTVMTDAKEDIAYLRSLAINNEEEKKLKMEGHTIHFDGYYDQGRDKPHTKYLLSKDVDWGLGVNYIEKDEGLKEIYSFLDGSMAGKEMLVKFFSLGP